MKVALVTPALLNLTTCVLFVLTRPPEITALDRREQERSYQSRVVSFSSDPYMYIAGRPLRHWDEWHGGEQLWVKAVEVLNWPAVIAAKRLGDRWSRFASGRFGSFKGDTWVRAYIYLVISSLQWFLVGMLLTRYLERRRSRSGVPASVSH